MEQKWTTVIKPNANKLGVNLKELVQYRDLVILFVKRNFVSQYKQTVLGPLWFIINPLITTFISTIVFGNIARIETDGVPYFLFHLCGSTLWGYFSTCVSQTSITFTGNAAIMGKVYFPRLVIPLATVIFSFINTVIVFMMTLITMFIYAINGKIFIPNGYVIFIPILFLQTAMLGMGVGIIISSLTTKYRDLAILVSFGLQLWMYITPVVYPVSQVGGRLQEIIMINPMAPIINNFRYTLLGIGYFDWNYWLSSLVITFMILLCGIGLFGKVEKTFMDTV